MTESNLRVGGTLDPRLDVYVVRPDDDKVIQLLLAGEYVAILTSRQMGKSSLVNKVARNLAAQGWLTAIVDLTVLGSGSDGPTYYKELMQELARKLLPGRPVTPDGIEITGSPRDVIAFIERVSEAAGTSRVAIFLDEIDSTLKLPYTDDLFTSIRAIYNERQVSGKCQNIAFCLIGVAMPDELVKDKRTTPYNIGQNIELDDFNEDRDDLTVLRNALSSNEDVAGRLLKRILYWTGGQPYLTIKVIAGVRGLNPSQPDDIDRYIATTYGTLESAAAQDVHFRYILRFVEERWNKSAAALELYERVLTTGGERDRASTAHAELKLAGLVKRDRSGMLRVRNRIYEQLFDHEWISRSLPKQQLVIYRRAAIVGGLASVGVVAASLVYRQLKVLPQEEQLQAREILAKLQVSLEVVDQISWARFQSSPDAALINKAVPQFVKLFPEGAGLGIDFASRFFDGNRVNGNPKLSESDIETALEPLPQLAGLSFEDTNIGSIELLLKFTKLKILSLENAKRIVSFSPLGALTNLEQLVLSKTSCSSLQVVENLSKLTNLSISNTSINDLTPLQSKNLRYFYAGFSRVSDVSVLSKATQLVEVGLHSTSVSSIAPLANAANLEALFLTATEVKDVDVVRNFTNLQKLSLNGQVVTRIDFLARLYKLRELLLRRIPFEDTSPLSGLTELQKLDLSQTRIASVVHLRGLTKLESLDLSATRITSVEPLATLVRMQTLSLRNTGVSTLKPLTGMTNLKNLDLSGCDAVDLDELRQIPSLQRVVLDASQLARLAKDLQRLATEQGEPRVSRAIDGEFGFNLGTEVRDFRGSPTWWSGPLDQKQ